MVIVLGSLAHSQVTRQKVKPDTWLLLEYLPSGCTLRMSHFPGSLNPVNTLLY